MKHSTIDKQAEVRALLVQGYTAPKVAAMTGTPERTVYNWRDSWQDLATEQETALAQRSIEIINLADQVQTMGLEHIIEQGGEAAAKALIAANAIRGTHTDKLQRRQPGNQFNVQVNVGRDRFSATIPGRYQTTEEAPLLESPLLDGD